MNIDFYLVKKHKLYLKNIFYHNKKLFMFISYMSNKNLQKKFDLAIKNLANKQPQTITYTPDDILKIVNKALNI